MGCNAYYRFRFRPLLVARSHAVVLMLALTHRLAFKDEFGVVHLLEHLDDWDSACDEIAVDSACDIASIRVVDSKDRVAAVLLAKAFCCLVIFESINEDRDKFLGGLDDHRVCKRTARKLFASRSARVFAEVKPQRFVLFFGDLLGCVVVDIPLDSANLDLLGFRLRHFLFLALRLRFF